MIHVGDLRQYDRLPPVEKLLTLVFALVGRDRAAWVRLDYCPNPLDTQLWYCVDGELYAMVPPPGELWPDLFRILWRNTRLPAADRPPWWRRRRIDFPARPVFGVLPVGYGDVVTEFDVLFFRGPTGEHAWIDAPRPFDPGRVCEDFLRRRMRGGQ